ICQRACLIAQAAALLPWIQTRKMQATKGANSSDKALWDNTFDCSGISKSWKHGGIGFLRDRKPRNRLVHFPQDDNPPLAHRPAGTLKTGGLPRPASRPRQQRPAASAD